MRTRTRPSAAAPSAVRPRGPVPPEKSGTPSRVRDRCWWAPLPTVPGKGAWIAAARAALAEDAAWDVPGAAARGPRAMPMVPLAEEEDEDDFMPPRRPWRARVGLMLGFAATFVIGLASGVLLLAGLLVVGLVVGTAMLAGGLLVRLLRGRGKPVAARTRVVDAEYHVVKPGEPLLR